MVFIQVLWFLLNSSVLGGIFGIGMIEMAMQPDCPNFTCAASKPLPAVVTGVVIAIIAFVIQLSVYQKNQQKMKIQEEKSE